MFKNISANRGDKCSIGNETIGPFSSFTFATDFCAHAHYDERDLKSGAAVLLSIVKQHNQDMQFHVLPEYKLIDSNIAGESSSLTNNSILKEAPRNEISFENE